MTTNAQRADGFTPELVAEMQDAHRRLIEASEVVVRAADKVLACIYDLRAEQADAAEIYDAECGAR